MAGEAEERQLGLTKRYRPQVLIHRPADPEHPAKVYSVLSDELLWQSATSPGKRDNLSWVVLRPDDKVKAAGLPGESSVFDKNDAPAVLLNYDIRWNHTYSNSHWTYEPSSQENEWRALARATYYAKLDQLNQVENPKEEDLEKIKTLQELLAQLSSYGEGYLETGWNLMGTDTSGIHWGLAVANVPVTVSSTFTLQKNRAQSFRLLRYEAPEGQVNHQYVIEIGNGSSLYDITLGSDGNSAVFHHYRNMPESKRKLLKDELEEILDFSRLVVSDRAQILSIETSIRRLKFDAKASGGMTPGDNSQVKSLQDQIDQIKDSKRGLTSIQSDRKSELENKLYLATEDFSLQEETKNLIGKPVDLTFQFLRSGYILITSSDGQKVYENKRLTGGVPEGAPPVYGDGLPKKCFIRVKSNGGKWDLVHGHPKYDNKGTMWTQPFSIPFKSLGEVEWIIESDQDGIGTKINYKLERLNKGKNQYQIRVELRSDFDVSEKDVGKYTPELYFAEMHIPAAQVGEESEVLWFSESEDNIFPFGSAKIRDLMITEEKGSSRLFKVWIAEGISGCNLPHLLGGAACDISLQDMQEGGSVDLVRTGCVIRADRGAHKNMFVDENDKINFTRATGTTTELEVVGCEAFLAGEIKHPITCNNRYVGDAIRALARDMGVPKHMYEQLPVGGENGCPRIKKIKPGSSPDVRPALGTPGWEYMKDLVEKHAPRWDLWSDENGLRLTKKLEKLRTDLNYSTLSVYTSKLMPRRLSNEPGGLYPFQETRNYYTTVTVIGGRNPLTGMRYSATESIPQATDKRFSNSAYYVKNECSYTHEIDETLMSDQACRDTARGMLGIGPLTPQGLTPWFLRWKVDFDPSVRTGQLVTVNAMRHVVESIEFSALNPEDVSGQQLGLLGRLAEEWKMDNDEVTTDE